jgi:hypothetical protein
MSKRLVIETRIDIDVNLNDIDVIFLRHGLQICHNAAGIVSKMKQSGPWQRKKLVCAAATRG